MVSYGGKTIPRWRTAAIFKIDISPYFSEKSSDFHDILYTAADFELDERHVIKNEKVALDRLQFDRTYFLLTWKFSVNIGKQEYCIYEAQNQKSHDVPKSCDWPMRLGERYLEIE